MRIAILGCSKAKHPNARMTCADFTLRRIFSLSKMSVDFSVIVILVHRRPSGTYTSRGSSVTGDCGRMRRNLGEDASSAQKRQEPSGLSPRWVQSQNETKLGTGLGVTSCHFSLVWRH